MLFITNSANKNKGAWFVIPRYNVIIDALCTTGRWTKNNLKKKTRRDIKFGAWSR